MAWTGLTLTVEGQNALNKAQLSNKMNIKSIVVGDGETPKNFRTLKGLVNQLYEITDLKIDMTDNGCTLTAEFPKVDYDYYFREIGIIVTTDDGEKLYVYDNCGDDAQYIVNTTGVENTKKRLRLSLVISDVAEITVSNPDILYVAYDDFEREIQTLHDTKVSQDGGDASDLVVDFVEEENLESISKDETLADTFGKIAKAVTELISHMENKDNPHEVDKEQLELGNVDNTADKNKPVSTAQRTAIDEAYYNSNLYTDEKIAALINGAPSTLDTLKEIADAMAENEDVVSALEEAVGKKANEAEFESHLNDKSNPHGVDKAQIGLDKVDNTADADKNVKYAVSAGNATKLGGMLPSAGNVKSTIVARDENGYTYLRYIYSDTGNNENPPVSQVIVTDGGNFFKKASLAHLKSQMGLDAVNNTADANKTVKSAGTCTGNSATATKLQTARTINGTSFNGSANITTANWGTARTVTIGNTGKSVNGSGNVSWSLSEIGAAASSHTHSYLPLSGGQISGALGVSGSIHSDTNIYTNNTAHFYANTGTTLGVGGQFYARGNNTYLVANNNNTQTYLQLQARSAVQCLATGSETTFIPCKASSYPGSSARRYKDNIVPMTEEEARKILDIEAVTFDYKEGIVFDSERFGKRGVIAEDVVDVIPSVVLYADIEGLGNVPDSVDYSKFAPYLIKMVQMQQEDINSLKETITVQNDTINKLLERIKKLENTITTE